MKSFVFYRKFRNKKYRVETPLTVTVKNMVKEDPQSKPYNKQRIEYVVVQSCQSKRNDKLIDKVIPLETFMRNQHLYHINFPYYKKSLFSCVNRFFQGCGLKEEITHRLFDLLTISSTSIIHKDIFMGHT